MYLGDESWPDLRSYFDSESLILIPLGSTEQHGPHLPEATDHLIAEAFARAAADRTGFLCTPTITIGVSPHHRQFPGTMWADPEAFRDFIESISRNITEHGVDRIVYVNAHGGNVEPLREVGRRLRDDGVAYAVEWMWDESIQDLLDELFQYPGPHGGPKETSLIQHLHPELVHDDRFETARDDGIRDVDSHDGLRTHGARTFYDAIDNTKSGVLGDQTEASGEKGARAFETATDQLVSLCRWLDELPFEDLMPEPHV